MELRGKAVVLMGKNTMIRKALAIGHEEHPEAGLDKLRAIMQGNIGFIFATPFGLNCLFPSYKQRIQGQEGLRKVVLHWGNHGKPMVFDMFGL